MSDFTKEELETMASWGEVYTELGQCWTDKIQLFCSKCNRCKK